MQSAKRILRGISLAALFAVCGISSLQSQEARPARPVMAVDAEGREIGTVLKMDYSLQRMQVALEVNDTLVPILLQKHSFTHGSRPVAYFQSPDCSGVAFLGSGAEAKQIGPPVGIAGPRGTVYWGYPETRQLREMTSALWGEECREFQAAIMAIDADPLMDLADQFTPPFGIAHPVKGDGRTPRGSRGRSRAQD